MKHRNVQQGIESVFDLEAARCADVLQIDPTVRRGNPHDRFDDFLDILRREAYGDRINPAELLK